MRCGCPECGAYMIQSESLNLACVCPECGYRCSACMGTNTVIRRDQLREKISERLHQAEEAQREFEGRI